MSHQPKGGDAMKPTIRATTTIRGRNGVQEGQRRARAIGFVPILESVAPNALRLCKLARTRDRSNGQYPEIVVLDNSVRSTPGEARRLRDIERDRTNIAWTVVEA